MSYTLSTPEWYLKQLENPDNIASIDDRGDSGWLTYREFAIECLRAPTAFRVMGLHRGITESLAAAVEHRRQHSPKKTSVESRLGVYLEEIVPHARGAVVGLSAKGYRVIKPEKAGRLYEGAVQGLRVGGRLPEDTEQFLGTLGVRCIAMMGEQQTMIAFKPTAINEINLRDRWDEIASYIPATENQS